MNAGQQHGRAEQRGFTLLELMVVIVLLAIMTALIIPEMRGTYEEALLRASARKLTDVFTIANSQAITRHELHRVRLDVSTGKFFVERRSSEATQGGFTRLQDVPGAEGEVDRRIQLEFLRSKEQPPEPARENAAEPGVIAFRPDGTADGESVLLTDRQGFRLLVRVNPATARVRVVEEPAK